MLGINRRPDQPDSKNPGRPALGNPPGAAASSAPMGSNLRPAAALPPGPIPAPTPPPAPVIAAPPVDAGYGPIASATTPSNPVTTVGDTPGSKLFVGVNIKLKGVEISDCDVLVVEGQVEATVSSKAMEIAKPGTLTGTAVIDVAEIHGVFVGELTARTRLVVHGSGRVSGTIRYGKLIVAEGGELNGDVKQLDAADGVVARLGPVSSEPRPVAREPSLLSADPAAERIARTGS
jgi:cytoskeletal protein CcmA (bactofilin family)